MEQKQETAAATDATIARAVAPVASSTGQPFKDPLSHRGDTAREILRAARKLLQEGGFSSLTYAAISEASGANQASIRYHFANKSGLVAAIVDYLIHDEYLEITRSIQAAQGERARLHAIVWGARRLSADLQAYSDFFELLPHVTRVDELRQRVAAWYQWWRDLNAEWLESDNTQTQGRMRGVAAVMVALIDGLALQASIDPEGFDPTPAFEAIQLMLESTYPVAVGQVESA